MKKIVNTFLNPHLFFIVFFVFIYNCTKSVGLQKGTNVSPIVTIIPVNKPILIENKQNELLRFKIEYLLPEKTESLNKILIVFSEQSAFKEIADIAVYYNFSEACNVPNVAETLFGKIYAPGRNIEISGNYELKPRSDLFQIQVTLKPGAILTGILKISEIVFEFEKDTVKVTGSALDRIYRFGRVLRSAGQDVCNTYRIPGLVTTNRGTLIAVYDNRYGNSSDLQGDIDIGMSRSTDGGQSWEPMKVIVDMGEWGGKPQAENGVGDPCILVDQTTGTIWVAALWINGFPGKSAWNASNPGLEPTETGQFLVVRSDDDGLTWSSPINLTSQLKKPEWRLLLQGPGRGISLSNGTIVFPAQFRDASGLAHSTIVFSDDHGVTWHIGTSAKDNTTEAQCVQLIDGSIMLNMRDNRNSSVKDATNGRAVAITSDLGQTWTVHSSSNSALPEPVCMASIISANISISGSKKNVLFFSNPNNKTTRSNMTIKASLDEGVTWPENFQVEVNQEKCYGYSCLTMVDDQTIGILYEGVKDIYFQKISVSDLIPLK